MPGECRERMSGFMGGCQENAETVACGKNERRMTVALGQNEIGVSCVLGVNGGKISGCRWQNGRGNWDDGVGMGADCQGIFRKDLERCWKAGGRMLGEF